MAGKWRTYKVSLPPDKAVRLDQYMHDVGVPNLSVLMEAWVDVLLEHDGIPSHAADIVSDMVPRARIIGNGRKAR
jgi:hypothetical protein